MLEANFARDIPLASGVNTDLTGSTDLVYDNPHDKKLSIGLLLLPDLGELVLVFLPAPQRELF